MTRVLQIAPLVRLVERLLQRGGRRPPTPRSGRLPVSHRQPAVAVQLDHLRAATAGVRQALHRIHLHPAHRPVELEHQVPRPLARGDDASALGVLGLARRYAAFGGHGECEPCTSAREPFIPDDGVGTRHAAMKNRRTPSFKCGRDTYFGTRLSSNVPVISGHISISPMYYLYSRI